MTPDAQFHNFFRRACRQVKLVDIAFGFLILCLFTFTFFFGEVLFDHLLILERPVRIALLAIYKVAASLLLLFGLLRPLFRRVSRLYVARRLELRYPQLKNRLVTCLQLGEEVPDNIREDLLKNVLVKLKGLRLSSTFGYSRLKPWALAFLALSVAIYGYALVGPKSVKVSVQRALYPEEALLPPTRTHILEVQPGNAEIVRGEGLEVRARVTGEMPDRAAVIYSADREKWQRAEVKVNMDGSLHAKLGKVYEPIIYYLRAADTRSERFRIGVVDPPFVASVRGLYQYPAYTKRATRHFEGGTVKALVGTRCLFEATSSVPVARAVVSREDGQRSPAKGIAPDRFSFEFLIEKDGYYSIELFTAAGHTNRHPPRYEVTAVPDEAPTVRVTRPARDLTLPADACLELQAHARDDLGLAAVHLHLKPRTEKERVLPLAFRARDNEAVIDVQLPVRTLGLVPGQFATYFLSVLDAHTPKPNRARSRVYSLFIEEPSRVAIAARDTRPSHTEKNQPEPGQATSGNSSERSQDRGAASPSAEGQPRPNNSGRQDQGGAQAETQGRQNGKEQVQTDAGRSEPGRTGQASSTPGRKASQAPPPAGRPGEPREHGTASHGRQPGRNQATENGQGPQSPQGAPQPRPSETAQNGQSPSPSTAQPNAGGQSPGSDTSSRGSGNSQARSSPGQGAGQGTQQASQGMQEGRTSQAGSSQSAQGGQGRGAANQAGSSNGQPAGARAGAAAESPGGKSASPRPGEVGDTGGEVSRAGAPPSSKQEPGDIDLEELRPGESPDELKPVQRYVEMLQEFVAEGEIKESQLVDLGLEPQEARTFVEKFKKCKIDRRDVNESPGLENEIRAAAQKLARRKLRVMQGHGLDPSLTTERFNGKNLEKDTTQPVTEGQLRRVPRKYREIVEEYFRSISEAKSKQP